MHKYIISTNSGIKSMSQLKNKMKDVVFIIVSKTKNGKQRKIKKYKNGLLLNTEIGTQPKIEINNSIIIRYGCTYPISGNENIYYNESSSISFSSRKSESRKEMIKKNVSCPKLYSVQRSRFPMIARPLKHSKGKDFNFIKTPTELSSYAKDKGSSFYLSEYVDKDKEFRVHCGHGKILLVKEKPRPKDKSQLIWNIDVNGEAFEYISWDNYQNPGIREACIESLNAVKALNLDFAAVDVMVKNNKAYVLEANTAPSLYSAEYTEERYIRYFEYLLNNTKNQKLDHWNYDGYEKASSFSWKNKQLNSNKNIINE